MDLTRRVLLVNSQPIQLHARAFDILDYLVACRDRAVTRDEIISHVWRGLVVGENNLSVQMSTLRRVLGQHGGERLIVTVPHRGYQFVEDAAEAAVLTVSKLPQAYMPPPEPHETMSPTPAPVTRLHPRKRLWAALVCGLTVTVLLGFVRLTLNSRGKAPDRDGTGAIASPPHSVAVMAFTNLSGDAAQEYFSDGLSEELIDKLGRIKGLRVPARLSSFSFKGRQVSIADIAKQLNVASILEGSVRRDGSRLRVTAQLIDAATGYQLWSNHFDADQGEIFKVQGEIAEAVTTALRVTLLDTDLAKPVTGGTSSPQAYDAFLRGWRLQSTGDGVSNQDRAALAAFDEALAIDPNYALAEANRAFVLVNLSGSGIGPDDSRKLLGAAIAAARHATSLSPYLGVAHGALAYALDTTFQFTAAIPEYKEATRPSPNDVPVEMAYALSQTELGHFEQGLQAAQNAATLDLLSPRTYSIQAWMLYLARHYDQALAVLRRARRLAPDGESFAADEVGFIHLMKGEPAHALADCAGARDWMQNACLAMAYHAVGRQQDAQSAFDRMRGAIGDGGAYNYALIYAQWGQPIEAFRWLEAAYRIHDSGLCLLKVDPMLDTIRNTPEFREMERRMKFPP